MTMEPQVMYQGQGLGASHPEVAVYSERGPEVLAVQGKESVTKQTELGVRRVWEGEDLVQEQGLRTSLLPGRL